MTRVEGGRQGIGGSNYRNRFIRYRPPTHPPSPQINYSSRHASANLNKTLNFVMYEAQQSRPWLIEIHQCRMQISLSANCNSEACTLKVHTRLSLMYLSTDKNKHRCSRCIVEQRRRMQFNESINCSVKCILIENLNGILKLQNITR